VRVPERNRGRSPILAAAFAALSFCAVVHAQDAATRTLVLEGGERVTYTLRTHPPDAHTLKPTDEFVRTSALATAKLLNLHLSDGNIEEAALLSNSPRRRFEVLREYRDAVGADAFKRVYAQYLLPENRLLADVAIGKHSLLVWELKSAAQSGAESSFIAGQYFAEIEGRYFIDDVPNADRSKLRWVLEAYRTGKIPRE
jgi:hypothetical protein